MKSKCSKPRPSPFGRSLGLLAVSLLWLSPRPLSAQAPAVVPPVAPAPRPDAEPDPVKLRAEAETQAHLRIWNLLPKDGGTFDVAPAGVPAEAGRDLASALRPGQFVDNYQSVAPGNYRLAVYKTGDRATPLAELPASVFARNSYQTLILIPGADPAHPRPLLVNDTYPFESTPTGQLFVWQGFDGAIASVTVGTERRERIPAHEARLFENLPVSAQPVPVLVQARKSDGKLVDYRLSVSYNDCRRAALLIVPDRFDRVRPRLVTSGEVVPPAARHPAPGQ